MNMKKTIAGVMAGAMAVSAMATMVSADQESISLTYDLKRYEEVKNKTAAQVQYVINYANGASDYGFSALTKSGADGFLTIGINDGTWFGTEKVGGKLHDVEVSFTSLPNVAEAESATAGGTIVSKWVHDGSNDKGDYIIKGYIPTGLNERTFKIGLDGDGDGKVVEKYEADGTPVYYDSAKILNVKGFDNAKLGQSQAAKENPYSFKSGVIKLTYEVSTSVYTDLSTPNFDKTSNYGWTWIGESQQTVFDILGMDYKGYKTLEQVDLMSGVTASVTGIKGVSQPVAPGTFKQGGDVELIYPMKSSLTKPANVTDALKDRKSGGKYYTNPVAVLNDAIANNENVVFEFKSYDGYVATAKSKLYGGDWILADVAHGYQTTPFDWYNPTFGQHLYTNLSDSYSLMGTTDYDMYGSYSSAWAQNLFTGAIVVNSGLTMQLSDTDKFNWGASTLSFDWFTITDEGKVTEAKTFLTKMLLYTPIDWYWDSLTVTVGNLEEDDIIPGEGADGDGDEISDEDGDEIVIDPIDEIDEPVAVDEPVVVTEAPVVTEAVTPVAPVESPKTGNAPVALAVIPVALAAAAVVAKKRG